MKAMLLRRLGPVEPGYGPLEPAELPQPVPGPGEVLVRVATCGVCHTELDEIEGRTPPPDLPVIPGHQVVGRVEERGPEARRFESGDRVGIGWIHSACGRCGFCRRGEENLCPDFRATGRDANGGYAEYLTVPQEFAVPIPGAFSDAEAAPLLCAGAIGYRSLRLAGAFTRLGLTGFGASGHLVLKMVRHRQPGAEVYVFARSAAERAFALELGAGWAGDTDDTPPAPLDAIIDTTPAWRPVVAALAALRPGGRLVINAIRKEEADKTALLALDYPFHLWLEKEVKSVANVTRRDIVEFLGLAAEIPLRPEVTEYRLADANRALVELKQRRIRGAKVLVVNGD
ncbi:MAG TPA: zinc-binding alcohol dehydrogenase family protein [candidate division WOR-3 bacterium]|uniref:alcohol dehydrogenase n=1 Tax=candidate division WOR-3 bacterium TaxID=2052148 RepID=A0A7V0T7E3_UNCW3|nr:zinc-binding alcohol dehydrogenase family protein [candidate division WOR-3 bacterium]